MSPSTNQTVKDYYARITSQDICAVARELAPDRVTTDTGSTLTMDCPVHASKGKKSLRVSNVTGLWKCWGCDVGGNVLHLVEWLKYGVRSKSVKGAKMTDTHVKARDWLGLRDGIGPLSRQGLTNEQIAETEEAYADADTVYTILTECAMFWHDKLMANKDVLKWMDEKWSITRDTMQQLQIGYADGIPHLIRYLYEKGFEDQTLLRTGLFYETGYGDLMPTFKQRITFPYWERGQVVYMIGRHTQWCHEKDDQKYRKLPVHDPNPKGKYHYVSPAIRNVIWNADILTQKPPYVIVTEGITDAITLMQHGVPVISPVTVRFRGADLTPLSSRLRTIPVFFVNDNEPSCAGLQGAFDTARALEKCGVTVRIGLLPLNPRQKTAANALRDTFGIKGKLTPDKKKVALEGKPEAERREFERLEEEGKQDVALYFAGGGTVEGFADVVATARTPLEFVIDTAIPEAETTEDLSGAVSMVLADIADLLPMEQATLLARLLDIIKRHHPQQPVNMLMLKQQLKQVRESAKAKAQQAASSTPAPVDDTAKAAVQAHIARSLMGSTHAKPDMIGAAQVWIDWLKAHGAKLYRTPEGEPFLYHNGRSYYVDASGKTTKRTWYAYALQETGVSPQTIEGRIFYDAVASFITTHGETKETYSWMETDIVHRRVWVALNNDNNEIVRIDADGVTVMQNGQNEDGILLRPAPKLNPITYIPGTDRAAVIETVNRLIVRFMTCGPKAANLMFQWLSSVFLMGFAGTRPMTRFEGPAGSGKTTAAKLLSTMLYGDQCHKTASLAANYTDGTLNPLLMLDNVETPQMEESLVQFFLTCATGISKEKRKAGTETENTQERVYCLLNTSGIEPLNTRGEVLTRTFIVNFDMPPENGPTFHEGEVLATIRHDRATILSYLFDCTHRVLWAIDKHNAQIKMMDLINEKYRDHSKKRCNDYLALMVLMQLEMNGELDAWLADPTTVPEFAAEWINMMRDTTRILAVGGNPTALAIHALVDGWMNAKRLDNTTSHGQHLDQFESNYGIELCRDADAVCTRQPITTGKLFFALQKIMRSCGATFPYANSAQFGCRIRTEAETLDAAGVIIETLGHSNAGSRLSLRVPNMFTDGVAPSEPPPF